MSSLRNSATAAISLGFLTGLGGCWGNCDITSTTFPHGLSSFAVTVQDLSGQLGNFPLGTVKIQVNAQALDENGNPFPFNGSASVYVTPGNIMINPYDVAQTPEQDPVLTFTNGTASGVVNALHVYGDTAVWVEYRALEDAGVGGYATGVSNPDLLYGYPLLAELQVTADNTEDPLENDYVILDETKGRCFSPDGGALSPPASLGADAGLCDPSQQYHMDLIVTAVQSDGFYAMDLNSYHLDPDAGFLVPNPGFDPNTNQYDLPGSWAYIFVYNYDAPELFLGNRLTTLSGTIGEFVADTQLDYPAWTLNSDPQFANPQPQDIPPPVAIDPNWCLPGASPPDIDSDVYLCEPSVNDDHLESLESGLVIARNVTMPDRWLNCDLTGTGEVPYQPDTGCMPTTNSEFCGPGEQLAQCPNGKDCVASECVAKCSTSADCDSQDQEACIDGHCQNACLCRAYCDSILGCTEQSEYTNYGQYDAWIPGEQNADGTTHSPWKLSFLTRNGAPGLVPETSPGMVMDIVGMLNQVRASDPMWEIVPRLESDICCHLGSSPMCTQDGGTVPVCPQPSSSQ